MPDERALFDAVAKAANGYPREQVLRVAANVIANVLRQSHPTLGAAEEELDDLVHGVKAMLAREHYDDAGKRVDRRIVAANFLDQLKLAARSGVLN